MTRMPSNKVDRAQNLLKWKRDERTGEFLQTMPDGNLGEVSKALKQPNFNPSDRANGARNEPSIEW